VKGTRVRRATAGLSLVAILAVTLVTLGLGLALKQPCAAGSWSDGRQYRQVCYSDIVPLLGTEHLQGGRLPYLDRCPPDAGQCDEYPVLTMYLMRVAAWIGNGYGSFFYANVFLLTLCALGTAFALYRLAGERALFFAAAPTLLIYAFVNWDLLAVAFTAGATLAYARRNDAVSGVLLGLGAAAKLYPALLLIPFVLGRMRERRTGAAVSLGAWAASTWAVVNLPFLLAARGPWSTFFSFNTRRIPDWDSLWFITCSRLHHGALGCGWSVRLVNVLSFAAFVAVAVAAWWVRRARDPDFPRWTFAFPLLVAFLVTNKVYSPQYGLWLLPWFALSLPNASLFAAFEVSDVAVFLTRFTWFGRLAAGAGDPAFAGFHGVPLGAFQAAVLVRAAVLILCLVVWALGREESFGAAPRRRVRAPAAEGVQGE
jgi:uncharacterized membrane protein